MNHLARTPVRLAVLAATLGGAAAAVVWVATYREAVPPYTGMGPVVWGLPTTYTSPAWTTPVAAVIAVAAVGVAALVLRRRSPGLDGFDPTQGGGDPNDRLQLARPRQ